MSKEPTFQIPELISRLARERDEQLKREADARLRSRLIDAGMIEDDEPVSDSPPVITGACRDGSSDMTGDYITANQDLVVDAIIKEQPDIYARYFRCQIYRMFERGELALPAGFSFPI